MTYERNPLATFRHDNVNKLDSIVELAEYKTAGISEILGLFSWNSGSVLIVVQCGEQTKMNPIYVLCVLVAGRR